MTSPCIVCYCTNVGNHRFPSNELRRAQWIKAIKYLKPPYNTKTKKPTKNSKICSAHFKKSDFSATPVNLRTIHHVRKILKKTAIPSVFIWENNLRTHPLSLQDSRIFDTTKVQRTYARTPPVAFVEEQLYLESATNDAIEDPLKIGSHESDILFDEESL